MQEIITRCPCCGRPFVFALTDDGAAVRASEAEIVRMASDLGVEVGAVKGGEEVGERENRDLRKSDRDR